MKIGIIQFPGSNCERETILAVKRAGMEACEFLWNEPIEKLREFAGYVIVGGFSYEDRVRAGIIAALDPVMQVIKAESEQGKPVLGICNGAQILVETGLVPGLENNKIGMGLTENKRIANNKILGTGFYNNWVYLKLSEDYQRNAFTRHLTHQSLLHVPIAHAEGRFLISDALLAEVKAQGLNVFEYCDQTGQVDPHFPINPNGSVANIAAISNKAGNILAMMPHPERTPNGDVIFQSMRDYILENRQVELLPLYYYPRPVNLKPYEKAAGTVESVVQLMITDNHAATVQKTCQHLGFPVTVTRMTHWEVSCTAEEWERIKKTGVLFNERKEKEVRLNPDQGVRYLVRAKEDLIGLQKQQLLIDHFSASKTLNIKHGILWQFSNKKDNIDHLIQPLLQTQILHNPYAHDCYPYKT